MSQREGWYPDPTGRYSHRRWDGEGWTSRVFASGRAFDDGVPVAVPAGDKLYCRVCHAHLRTIDWKGRCHRCTLPRTSAYIAAKPYQEFKGGGLVRARKCPSTALSNWSSAR